MEAKKMEEGKDSKNHLLNAGKELGQFVSSLWGDAVGRIVNPIQEWKATEKVRLPSRSVSSTLTCGRYKELYGDYSCRDGKDYPIHRIDEYASEALLKGPVFLCTGFGREAQRAALRDTAIKYELHAKPKLIIRDNSLQEIKGSVRYRAKKICIENTIIGSLLISYDLFSFHYEGTILGNGCLENSVNKFMAAMGDETPLRVRKLYTNLCQLVLSDVKNYKNSIEKFINVNQTK